MTTKTGISIYRQDQHMTSILQKSKFTISAEVIPPRNGAPQSEILDQIESLVKAGCQFMSVTKGAGGSLRGGSLPIAQVIKDHFQIPCIAHFTCRDLSPDDVENQLMDHHYFGIRNILALRGDPPTGQIDYKAKEGSYPYAYQLIQQIKNLNSGKFLERAGFKTVSGTQTDFCIGAAAYPDAPTHEERVGHFKLKVDAGAEYGITQMIYSTDSYKRFLDEITKANCHVPILPGARVLRTKSQADRMRSKFGIHIPDNYYNKLPEQENPSQALEVFFSFVEELQTAGAPGLHVFVLVDTALSCQVIEKFCPK